MTKISATLPKDEANGLVAIHRQLVNDPHRVHAAIVLLDCKRVTIDNDTAETVPTARIRRIEVVAGEDLDLLERLFRRALEKRSGQTTLPLELEDELSDIFAHLTDVDGPPEPPSPGA